jgi:hypothetical protein
VIVSIPKLKTHKKAGVTLNMKNAIGINSGKEYMPHYRPGQPPRGDAFPHPPPKDLVNLRKRRLALKRSIARIPFVGRKLNAAIIWLLRDFLNVPPPSFDYIEHGDWYGNDTIWRTIIDLNRILLYADCSGKMRETPQRGYFSLVDGIIGSQGEGPMTGFGIPCGVLIGGYAPLTVDVVATRIMGFEPSRVPQLRYADQRYFLGYRELSEIEVIVSGNSSIPCFNFIPPKGWRGYVEAK